MRTPLRECCEVFGDRRQFIEKVICVALRVGPWCSHGLPPSLALPARLGALRSASVTHFFRAESVHNIGDGLDLTFVNLTIA
jgi:hypothetical protein